MITDDGIEEKVNLLKERKEFTISEALGIELTVLKKRFISATMPVDNRTKQPFGLLHGGASVVLGETLCSVGAWLNVDEGSAAVGLEINANHIRAVRDGIVTGTAEPIHIGRSIQVWVFEIRNESDKLVCSGRCTLSVIKAR